MLLYLCLLNIISFLYFGEGDRVWSVSIYMYTVCSYIVTVTDSVFTVHLHLSFLNSGNTQNRQQRNFQRFLGIRNDNISEIPHKDLLVPSTFNAYSWKQAQLRLVFLRDNYCTILCIILFSEQSSWYILSIWNKVLKMQTIYLIYLSHLCGIYSNASL